MLGRKSYTREELDHGRSAVERQLAAYDKLVGALPPPIDAAREDFEGTFFNDMTLVLDRYFVHRLRTVTGKDGNPLNEVELICESLMNNEGVLRGNNVVKYVPAGSVVKLEIGDRIHLTREQFGGLSTAFLAELEQRFL
jgi:hypothetical protein